MKKIKELLPAIILSFAVSFTIFICEPVMLYVGSVFDMWFDFFTMMKSSFILFLLMFMLVLLFYYILSLLKNKNIYKVFLIIGFAFFIVFYIQGNYFIGNLTPLDGRTIEYDGHVLENIAFGLITLIVICSYIFVIKKFNIDKVINISKYVSLAICFMLLTSMVSVMLSTDGMFIKKNSVNATTENYNVVSSKNNMFIFLVDAIDSKDFNEVLINSEYKDMFEDFTYYPDTLSAYPFTRDSIPMILSGNFNDNSNNFYNYYDKALNNSKLINKLIEENYSINLYETELEYVDGKIEFFDNVDIINSKLNLYRYFVHETKFVGYKYLPYFLKKYIQVENMNFNFCKNIKNNNSFVWNNKTNYNSFVDDQLNIIDKNYFNFTHLEGAHYPFSNDEFVYNNEYTYEDNILAAMKVIKAFLDRLKENNVYDNSSIIILSDHGYDNNGEHGLLGRFNPILYIKGINEHHKMNTSNKMISYFDLQDSYMDLLNNKKSTQLFSNIGNNRVRTFINHNYLHENHMVEYETNGKAWEIEKFKETGRVFDR